MAVRPGAKGGRGTPGLAQLGLRLLLGAAVLLAALFVLQRSRGLGLDPQAATSGTIRIGELAARIEILRDARGIPHVYADREREVFFGLGFAHAEDRLAQMVWLRSRAQGRTAEVEGADGLVADRLARLLAIERAADAAVEALPGPTRAVLEAYAAGVNARMDRIREERAAPPPQLATPIEATAPWRPADSLAVVKLLSWCIGGTLETTLVLDELIERLDSVQARPFFPGRASVDFGEAPSLPMLRSFEPGTGRRRPDRALALDSSRALCRGIGHPTGGAWVIGAEASASGSPLLVADWQLEPSVPGLFHEVELRAGALEVLGATVPGSPIVWIGRSRALAWAAVPAGAPIADLFIETLSAERPGMYQNGALWAPLEERSERFAYADRGGSRREQERVLRSTRHGPLIEWLAGSANADGDAEPPAESTAKALAWTGARSGDGVTSMLALLSAGGGDEVKSALAQHHEPVLALAYADRSGRAGVQVAGWLPHRPLPTGLVPVQGRLRSFDWRHRVAIDDLPALRLDRAPRPWVAAADQPWPVGPALGEVEFLWRPGDRAARLEAELDRRIRGGPIDLRAAAEMLADHGTERAPAVVRAVIELARTSGPLEIEALEIVAILERWDGGTGSASAGAAAYHLLIERLLDHLLREPFGPALFDRYVRAPHVRPQDAIERLVLRAAALRRPGGWTDEARVVAAARRSLREAWVALGHRLGPARERWEWGELHRLRFTPFVPFGDHAEYLWKGLRSGGSAESLAVARHRPGVSLEVEAASLYRVAMDLSATDRILSCLAPGQSEVPGHPNASDGVERFRAGRMVLFATDRLAIEEESVARLVLEPSP